MFGLFKSKKKVAKIIPLVPIKSKFTYTPYLDMIREKIQNGIPLSREEYRVMSEDIRIETATFYYFDSFGNKVNDVNKIRNLIIEKYGSKIYLQWTKIPIEI